MEFGKFNSLEDLVKGYNALEQAFTQKCQQVKELQNNINSNVTRNGYKRSRAEQRRYKRKRVTERAELRCDGSGKCLRRYKRGYVTDGIRRTKRDDWHGPRQRRNRTRSRQSHAGQIDGIVVATKANSDRQPRVAGGTCPEAVDCATLRDKRRRQRVYGFAFSAKDAEGSIRDGTKTV